MLHGTGIAGFLRAFQSLSVHSFCASDYVCPQGVKERVVLGTGGCSLPL